MTDEDRQIWMSDTLTSSEDSGEANLFLLLYFMFEQVATVTVISVMRCLCKIVFAKCKRKKIPIYTDWTVEPKITLPVLVYNQSFSS